MQFSAQNEKWNLNWTKKNVCANASMFKMQLIDSCIIWSKSLNLNDLLNRYDKINLNPDSGGNNLIDWKIVGK